jgi:hypothetical protein
VNLKVNENKEHGARPPDPPAMAPEPGAYREDTVGFGTPLYITEIGSHVDKRVGGWTYYVRIIPGEAKLIVSRAFYESALERMERGESRVDLVLR